MSCEKGYSVKKERKNGTWTISICSRHEGNSKIPQDPHYAAIWSINEAIEDLALHHKTKKNLIRSWKIEKLQETTNIEEKN